jgi:hypothetical protein
MSLKAFHILFILCSTALCVVFGVWALRQYAGSDGSGADLALGISSLLLSGVLVGYGKYFLRKLKHISYL